MQSFYYRSGRNAATALISGSLAALTGWQWWTDGDVVWMISAFVLGLAGLKGALNSMNSEPAVKFDGDRLWVRTTFGSRVMTWQQVYGIALQVMTVRYWGVVPIRRVETLCIACEGGAIGAKRLRFPASAIGPAHRGRASIGADPPGRAAGGRWAERRHHGRGRCERLGGYAQTGCA